MTLDQFLQCFDPVRKELVGYNEDDLNEIGHVYGIKIVGQLADFLRIMGRSDGGLIGDYDIQLYRSMWDPSDQLEFQLEFHNDMRDLNFNGYLKKPFVVAWLSENQYFFVQTASEQPDAIYHFDEVEETVEKTDWDLFGFIALLVEDNKDLKIIKSVGNLL